MGKRRKRRKSNLVHHGVDFSVEFRVFGHGDEENSASQRVSDVRQSWKARHRQDVIYYDWDVKRSYFIPADEVYNNESFNLAKSSTRNIT